MSPQRGVIQVRNAGPELLICLVESRSDKSDSDLSDQVDPDMSQPPMEQNKYTILFLSLAVIMDVVGLLIFLVGIFASLSYWDFFVLSGPLLIFLSLIPWIFWYMGNLTVSEEELNLIKPDIL